MTQYDATVIGYYAGEGSNVAELGQPGNEELIVMPELMWSAPAAIRERLAEKFVQQRFQSDPPAAADFKDSMVILAVLEYDGTVYSGEKYEEIQGQ